MRAFRWMLAAGLIIAVAGVAWAGGSNCQSSAKACADKASVKNAAACTPQQMASGCCSKSAGASAANASAAGCPSAATCTSASAQCKDMAKASDCSYCGFRKELGASTGKVNFSAIDTRDGVIVVFAAASKQDVATAQALAAKAYAMMNAPAHCEVTKAKMASSDCTGCKDLDAFTKADVKVENTDEGARAVVVSADQNSVAKLHAFFHNLQATEKAAVKG